MRGSSRSFPLAAGLLLLLVAGCGDRAGQEPSRTPPALRDELARLRAVNAVLRARVVLSREDEAYLILDLPEREVRLELQGVTLTRVPIRGTSLNRKAREISRDTTRIAFCEIPFVLEEESWFEETPTLALKDSSAIRSQPDTTGRLAERIRRERVLALLRFDRELVVALNGRGRSSSFAGRLLDHARALWRLVRSGPGERAMRGLRREAVFVELSMDPADVRTLAPSLKAGTRLVLRF